MVDDAGALVQVQRRLQAAAGFQVELAAFQPLLNKLLAKDPAQRFGSAREVLEAIEQASAPPIAAEPLPALAG